MMNKKRFYRGFTLIGLLLARARRSCQGFTLIELMVVITIMITSGIVVLPKLTQFRNSSEVEEEVSRMLSAVKQAQSNAFVGAQCGDQFAPAFKSISWNLPPILKIIWFNPTVHKVLGFLLPISI